MALVGGSCGDYGTASNKFNPNTSVHVTPSIKTKITSTLTSHDMQAQKQSTGQISPCHWGVAKDLRSMTPCRWEVHARHTWRHVPKVVSSQERWKVVSSQERCCGYQFSKMKNHITKTEHNLPEDTITKSHSPARCRFLLLQNSLIWKPSPTKEATSRLMPCNQQLPE